MIGTYKPRHLARRRELATDGPSMAVCTCPTARSLGALCPNCSPGNYADAMARHASAYDGSYDGIGSTISAGILASVPVRMTDRD